MNNKIKFNILAIICIMIFCFSLTPVTFQNDTYYTIKIGEHIVNTGEVDMQDPFSWHKDLPYTYPHWLYDVGTYLVYSAGEIVGIGGFAMLYIATVILSIILGLTIYYIINKLSKNEVVSLFITLIIMYLLRDFIAARAQLVTFILFALTILFIELFLETKKKRYAVYLIIIPILIANLHCAVWPFYFVLYLPYIAEYIIVNITKIQYKYIFKIKLNQIKLNKMTKKGVSPEEIGKMQEKIAHLQVEKEKSASNTIKRREKPYKIILKNEPAVKWLILVMLICILTGFLTPLDGAPYTYLVKTMQGNTMDSISEHQPLTLINNKILLTVFFVYIVFLMFTDTKASLRDFFMIGGLTLLTLMSRRQASIFAIICGIIFAKLFAKFLDKYDKKGSEIAMEFMTSILGKILTILIVILISFVMYRDKMDDKFINESSYPVAAASYILENLDVQNIRLFNEYNYGSYLLFRDIPVFIDSRADLYAPEFNGTKNEEGEYVGRDIFSDYINTSNIGTYYEDTFNNYDITHVIVGANTKLKMFLAKDERYEELYADEDFVVYERLDN